ncbi:MAG TPA: glycosyl transferase [Nitrospinota bacterium]|nr:glycosyl transferase [Nitrospinota bacterium]
MGDFYQVGVISTFHRLGKIDIDKLESQLKKFSRVRPIALVLPALFTDLEGEAMKTILNILKDVKYLNEIIVTLGRADESQFKRAREIISVLPHDVKIIWNDGQRLQKLYALLKENDLDAGGDGKGRSAWISYGYILAEGKSDVIVLHDCDIVTYDRQLLARLCYPVANPNLDYEFCKGYYARITDRMHGRVTRLLVTPLIRSMTKIMGTHPMLSYFDSFRYSLSGEFAMFTDMARINRIPGDWGLEIGVLAEVYRNSSSKRICQVDISDNYEHRHQPLSAENASTGLMKMAIDISKTLFRNLATEGVTFSDGLFKSLRVTYLRTAQDMMKRYHDDAMINGLFFDRHSEELAISSFAQAIKTAGEQFMDDPLAASLIPNWNRVTSAIPDFFDMLMEAVNEDNK